MKTIKCPLCGSRHKDTEWKKEDGQEICFSCKSIKGMVDSIKLVLAMNTQLGQVSKQYWLNKLDI